MKESKPIVGITFSTFDLLHAGHIRMLADAKTQCDYLIVGLQTDPTIDRPEKNKTYANFSGAIYAIKRMQICGRNHSILHGARFR